MSKNDRVPYAAILPTAIGLMKSVGELGLEYGQDFRVCGSVRRNTPDCGDIDIAITSDAFALHETDLRFILDRYEDTKKGKLHHGFKDEIKVEFYVGPADGFGALVLFATGNPAFNVRCRQIANSRGWSLNQYGLWSGDSQSGKMVCDCTTEESILETLGLSQFNDPLSRSGNGYHAH